MALIEIAYTPPAGRGLPTLKFGNDSTYDFMLVSHDGLGSNAAEPSWSKGPGQVGVTAVDARTDARVISLEVALVGDSAADHWNLRRKLARGLAVTPTLPGETMELGFLTVTRGGAPGGNAGFQPGTLESGSDLFTDLQIPAVPRNSPLDTQMGDNATVADIEFWCPYPYFTPRIRTQQTIATSAVVNNVGEQYAPLTIVVNGPATRPRIVNSTTGRKLEIGDDIPVSQSLVVSTFFGNKYVRRNDAVSMMHLVNPQMSDFWSLKPGSQTVSLEKAGGSGSMTLYWWPRFSGL